jgi:hypothetical protein
MGTKRDYLQVEDEFNKAQAIVSSLGDLLEFNDSEHHVLADTTLVNVGSACYWQAEEMYRLFYELMDMYLDKKKAQKK